MKKFYNEYFRVTEHEKIRDKVMLMRVVITVVIIIACLAGMTFTAYAYFSQNVTSTSNRIKSANFTVDTTINVTENGTDTLVDVKKIDSVTYSADLKAGKTYKVTLAYGENSTATTGFCIITAENCSKEYHSQQLGADKLQENGKTPSITFNLTVSKDTTVTFTACWGTSVYYADYAENYENYPENGDQNELYITKNETVNLNIVDSGNADTNTDTQNLTNTNTTTNQVTTSEPQSSGTLNSIVNGTSGSEEASQATTTTSATTSTTTTTTSTPTDNNNPDDNVTSDAILSEQAE